MITILFVNSGNDHNFFVVVELVTHNFGWGRISHSHFLWQWNWSHIIIVGVEIVTLIFLWQRNRSHLNFSSVTNSTLIFLGCDHFHPYKRVGWNSSQNYGQFHTLKKRNCDHFHHLKNLCDQFHCLRVWLIPHVLRDFALSKSLIFTENKYVTAT